jgi:hypothetical protein
MASLLDCQGETFGHLIFWIVLMASAGILIFQPMVERREVIEHRLCIQVIGSGHFLQRLLPWTRLSGLKHSGKFVARCLGAVEAATIQRPLVSAGIAHRFIELELVNACKEISGIGDICRNVILGSGIKVGFCTLYGRGNALVSRTECPPLLVVISRLYLAGKNLPAPLVECQRKGKERDLVESGSQLQGDVCFGRRLGVCQPQSFQVCRGD